jgi:purine-nucleoside phosphorylase
MPAVASIASSPRPPSADFVAEAADVIGRRLSTAPTVAVILGSGLGRIAHHAAAEFSLPYDAIPGFPAPTADGHAGCLTCVASDRSPVLLLAGRKHLYEGVAPDVATFPIRVLERLGVQTLILTNAAGGLHPSLAVGDIVVLEDGLNFTFTSPLPGRGAYLDRPLFDPQLATWALEAAREARVPATSGVYAAVTGPNYETRAEQRMYRRLGADVIGMSTLPEATVAVSLGMRVLGLSTVTNCCRPDAPEPTDGAAVVHAAGDAADRVLAILRGVIRRCTQDSAPERPPVCPAATE